MKKGNIFGYNPSGMAIPKKLAIAYLILFGVVTLVFFFAKWQILAALTICMGLCVFVMTDVLYDQLLHPDLKKGKRIHGTIICCFSGGAAVFCLVRIIQYFVL